MRVLFFSIFLLLPPSALARPPITADAPMRVAVASNYANTLNELIDRYRLQNQDAGAITVSIGSTGKLYAQIKKGAPFDLFLAADRERPERLAAEGFTIGPSYVYTIGQLALWHPKSPSELTLEQHLTQTSRLAIANPELAPYGLAAQQTLGQLNWQGSVQTRVILAENIGQTFAMVSTGNATAGFVALSQLKQKSIPAEQFTLIDTQLHGAIAQHVVLLAGGAQRHLAADFLSFLLKDSASIDKAASNTQPSTDVIGP